MSRKGDWMLTYTGAKFWPMDPRESEVYVEDIAHALSVICRFGGHCREFYSVAQHSCYVADMLLLRNPTEKRDVLLTALLHDAEEAYGGDVIRPIKRCYPQLVLAMTRIWTVIARRFDLISPLPDVVKWADNVMLKNEYNQLMRFSNGTDNDLPACDRDDGPAIIIEPWSPAVAEVNFLEKFHDWR